MIPPKRHILAIAKLGASKKNGKNTNYAAINSILTRVSQRIIA
jgi:hypothetical protein